MAQKALRFGVREGNLSAATWKLWTETSARQVDIYLACRETGGEWKASMHEKGGWHVAHSKRYFQDEAKGFIPLDDRYIDRWQRPDMIVPGVTLAIQIVTPWWSVTTPIKPGYFDHLTEIPNAARGRVTLVSIFLVSPDVGPPPWSREVGRIQVGSGEAALVSYWTADASTLAPIPRGAGSFYRGKGMEDLLQSGNPRMLAFATAPNGAKVIFDYAIRSIAFP